MYAIHYFILSPATLTVKPYYGNKSEAVEAVSHTSCAETATVATLPIFKQSIIQHKGRTP